ncbi:MAG: hypothetical protein E7563_01140 [Ruminococcaceae bacterium]|nr:hypothetical protein [Oscillospiraceae bacterium]
MSKGKKVLVTLIIIFVTLSLIGTGLYISYLKVEEHIEEHTNLWKKTEYVAFAKEASDKPMYVPIDTFKKEMETYRPKWRDYNNYTYYNIVTEEEQLIYKIYEYAMDNNMPYIYIEGSLIPAYKDIHNAITLLSLDSAVIDQNTQLDYINAQYEIYQQYLYRVMVKKVKCVQVHIPDFNEEKTKQIEECITKAEEILENLGIKKMSTEKEKAEAIYLYLGKNVKYKDYEDVKSQHFLHDALIKNSSNCDGYANAFSLMCNMAGIDCFEKKNTHQKGDKSGHTWNTVRLDDVWYNVDATASPSYYEGNLEGIPYRFGYSDNQQSDRHQYTGCVPECNTDIIPADCTFKSTKDKGIADKASKALKNTDKDYILLVFDEFHKEDAENIMQDVANTTYSGIVYVHVDGHYHTLVLIKYQ